MRALGVGPRHDDRELVATDPEGPVGAAEIGGDGRRRAAQESVADRVAARVVDPLEVVEVDDGEGKRLAVADRHRPLPLHLLLECPVIAEPGQGVSEGLGTCPVVGVLEDPARLLEPLGRFEHPARQPDRERAEDDRQGHQAERRDHQRGAEPPRQAIDHRRRDGDRDREHRDEREEQAETDQSQIGRLAEGIIGRLIVVVRAGLHGASGCTDRYSPGRNRVDEHRGTRGCRTNGCVRALGHAATMRSCSSSMRSSPGS